MAEISSGIAGSYCGWLLGQLGANVKRLNAESATLNDHPDAIALALAYFNSGKTDADPAGAWHDTDIVITDDVPRLEAFAGEPLAALSRRFPHLVIGAASIFGLSGRLAGIRATPLDAQAVSSVSFALGEQGRPPLSVPPGVLECQAGVHLAAACLMARFVGAAPGQARIADVALADVLAAYVAVNCRFYIHHAMAWERAGRRASGSGGAYPFVILPCADGDVCLTGRARPEWERFVEAMGSPEWARQPRYQRLRAMGQQYPEEVDALVLPWLRRHTKAEIEDIANRYQLTIAPLRTMPEVLATPQLHDRGFLHDWRYAGPTLQAPGLPFRITGRRAPDAEDQAGRMLGHAGGPSRPAATGGGPLAGVRVLDLGWVWSAPQVGSILAQFGAEVIKVEHSRRLDNARMSGQIFRNGQKVEGPSTEMSPMFHQINRGKLGITLNMKEPAGIDLVKRLVARTDIVLENMSAGTMERTGLGYQVLRALNDRLIMVAMSGAGQFGPLADMRTYAPSMSSFAGLETLVGYQGEAPVGALNFALGDPNAAAHALLAVFAALVSRQSSGHGCYIDLSQTEALITTLTPYLLLSQVAGRQPGTMGNAHPTMAPHGIYPAAGTDRWLTIAIEDDRQWRALAVLGGDQPWACDDRFATAAGRVALREELDGAVAAWTALHERDGLVATLRQAGIPSSPVQSIDEMWSDEQFAARAMREPVELPVLGPEDLFRAPWLFSDFAPQTGTRGPRLGEHNERVLQGILGLSAADFDSLTAAGVIL